MNVYINLGIKGEIHIDIPDFIINELKDRAQERHSTGRTQAENMGDILMEWILYGRLIAK